jgi:hypothetical protein
MLPRTSSPRKSERTRERASIAGLFIDGQMTIQTPRDNCNDAAFERGRGDGASYAVFLAMSADGAGA